MNTRGMLLLLVLLAASIGFPACGGNAHRRSGKEDVSGLAAELKDALLSEMARLGADPARAVAKPPSGEGNMVNDLRLEQVDDGWALRWSYRNLGDYDQNGTVAIADITPLAQHYQETWEIGEENSLAAVIDGSGNSRVGIEDVTPIAANFGAQLSGYVIETASSIPGEFAEYASAPFESFIATGGRLAVEHHMEVIPAKCFRLSAYDEDGERSVVSGVLVPELPGPEITAVRPVTCAAGTAVRFQLDVTGEGLRQYAWDFGGGGTPLSSTEASPIVVFSSAGVYSCGVTVLTPFGIDSEDFQLLVVEPGTSPYILDVQPQAGLAGVETAFTADAGGDEPLTYAWDFGTAVAIGERYSSDPSPSVALTLTSGSYPVSLTVANSYGSDTYDFTFVVVEGLNMQLLSIRVRLDGAVNTTPDSIYLDGPLFAPLLSGDPNDGAAPTRKPIKGELEAISYYYSPDEFNYGFDDEPPVGKAAAYAATLSYLSQLLQWSIELTGYSEGDLFTHDEMEPPGRLWGTLGDIAKVYTVTAHMPPNPFSTEEPVELVIMLDVSNP